MGGLMDLITGGSKPKVKKTEAAPTAEDSDIEAARRRRVALARRQSGVQSSILSTAGERETLGGG